MNSRGKAELHFLLTLTVKSCKGKMRVLLTDSAALERVNATTVGGAIIRRLIEKGVDSTHCKFQCVPSLALCMLKL